MSQASPPEASDVRIVDASLAIADGVIAGYRFSGGGRAPLLFCHANGFCASTYRQALRPLADRFDVFAIDLRGHGRTTLPADPAEHRSYHHYAADIAAYADAARARFGLEGDWLFAGHSMGALSALMATKDRADVSAVRLVEPVLLPRTAYAMAYLPFSRRLFAQSPIAKGALARNSRWPDKAAVIARYRQKPIFQDWAPGVLEDYLDDGLVEVDGGVGLACDPLWEAANFIGHRHYPWPILARLKAPLAVLAAARGSTVPAPVRAGFKFHGAKVIQMEGAGHLAPMSHPIEISRFIAAGALENR